MSRYLLLLCKKIKEIVPGNGSIRITSTSITRSTSNGSVRITSGT